MDREGLKNASPTEREIRAAPPHAQKALAERHLENVLVAIAEDKREPDAWEAQLLSAAIGAIVARWYVAALAYTDKSVEAPERRAESWPRQADTPSLAALREGLEAVRVLPTRAG